MPSTVAFTGLETVEETPPTTREIEELEILEALIAST